MTEDFHEYYKNFTATTTDLLALTRKTYLGEKTKYCRYCKQSFPVVTFRKTAHAVPEFLGNRYLIDHNECDSCNEKFSSTLENSAAEFFKPLRVGMAIEGRNGTITYKEKTTRMEWREKKLPISNLEGDHVYIDDEGRKRLQLPIKIGRFTPIHVYKLIVKIGLSMIPISEIGTFSKTTSWMLGEDVGISDEHCLLFGAFIQENDKECLVVTLLRSKDWSKNFPYYFVNVQVKNFIVQCHIPVGISRPMQVHSRPYHDTSEKVAFKQFDMKSKVAEEPSESVFEWLIE